MKITSVECHLLTVDLAKQAFSWPGGSIRYWTVALVEVSTDEGVTGLGEVYAGLFAPEPTKALVDQFAGLLVGQNPLDVPALYERMVTKSKFWGKAGLPLAVIGVIENALWDILGKVKGVPVWQLLGGKSHDSLPVYASGGLDSTEEGLTRELERHLEKGFRAVKIRIGRGLEEDTAKLRLARRVLGEDVELMVDAVMGHHPNPWSADDALRRAKVMEELGVVWFEEPCGNRDYAGYAKVRANTKVAIAGGESAVGLHEYKAFLDANALDWIQPDAAHSGGIIECQRIAVLAKERGVRVVYHSWGAAPCLLANYHLAFGDRYSRYLEFPTHGLPLIDELAVEPFKLVDGRFKVPNRPGLGVKLTKETLRRYPYKPNSHFWP